MKKHDYCPKHKRWHSIHAEMHCRTNTPICNTGGLKCALAAIRSYLRG